MLQPKAASHDWIVHSLLSSHSMSIAVWTHSVPTHSSTVQAKPSSQEATCVHTPATVSHRSAVQGLPSEQSGTLG